MQALPICIPHTALDQVSPGQPHKLLGNFELLNESTWGGVGLCDQLSRLAGEIMVSAMGDKEGKGKGGFVLLDEDFKVP